MQNSIKEAVLVVLLAQLKQNIDHEDGAAAVATIDLIGKLAGSDYRHWLLQQSLTEGSRRLAERRGF